MYNVKSLNAEEFINHEEILESLEYAEKNKSNTALLNEILEKVLLIGRRQFFLNVIMRKLIKKSTNSPNR